MADVTAAESVRNSAVVPPPHQLPVDPTAVRLRLAEVSRRVDDPTMVVAPARSRALGPDAPEDPDSVLAQRQPLVDGAPQAVGLEQFGEGHAVLSDVDGALTRVILEAERAGVAGAVVREVLVAGFRFEVELEPERIAVLRERASKARAATARSGPLPIKGIIPGKVVQVSVAVGDAVTAGQQLLVVEAMKMQNELKSPRDGTIERVGVALGDNVEVGDLLIVIT